MSVACEGLTELLIDLCIAQMLTNPLWCAKSRTSHDVRLYLFDPGQWPHPEDKLADYFFAFSAEHLA